MDVMFLQEHKFKGSKNTTIGWGILEGSQMLNYNLTKGQTSL
jgi:hypothetical protein